MAQNIPFSIASQAFVNNVQVANATLKAADNTLLQYVDTVAAATSNQPTRLAFAHAQVQAYWLESDQPATLDVNSSGSPTPAISLAAGVPQFFVVSAGQTSLFTVDVTEIFISVPGATAANVNIYVLVHGSV